jgi:hypothetical protein
MSRGQILGLSVACCALGAVAIYGGGPIRGVAFVLNFALAVALAIIAGRDLDRRGVRLAWLVGISYVLAPLVGFVLYAIFSGREAPSMPAG